MISIGCAEAARAMGGRLLPAGGLDPTRQLPTISTDTRTLEPGQTFVALTGERFNGHDFLDEAVRRGARVAVVSEAKVAADLTAAGVSVVEVPETTGALQLLAHYLRRRWGGAIVAITGSMGKTTTKVFAARLLACRYRVLESAGNLNNQVGVPLSLLRLETDHEIGVLELGMNQPGEIERLARVAAPETGVLTNIAPAHLEFFDDLEGIAAAKGELLGPLGDGTLVFNRDDVRLQRLAARFEGPKVAFGFDRSCPIRVLDFRLHGPDSMTAQFQLDRQRFSAELPFAGRPFLYNLAAAMAVAVTHGIGVDDIRSALTTLESLPGRGRISQVAGVSVWDDSYNANPKAMEALLSTVAEMPGRPRTLIVLGAMLELGPESQQLHRDAGRAAAAVQPALLVSVGEGAQAIGEGALQAGLDRARIHHFDDAVSAGEFVSAQARPGDLLVVKGSRGTGTEAVVKALESVS